MGRLSALILVGVAAGPVWAEPTSLARLRGGSDETYVSWCGRDVADDPTLFTRCRYGDARTVVARANYQW
jgi:hypothetical protein